MKHIKLIILIITGICCLVSPVSNTGEFVLDKDINETTTIAATETTTVPNTTAEPEATTQETTQESTTEKTTTTRSVTYNNDDAAGSYDWEYTKNSQYPIRYTDSSMAIQIDKVWYRNAWCYVAQIKMTDYTKMKSICANDKFGNGKETCLSAAKRTNAILAVNACHSNIEQNIPVVRNGRACNLEQNLCNFPACYNKYTGQLSNVYDMGASDMSVEDAVEQKKITDGFCFGPEFDLVNLENNDDGETGGRAQRTFIGTDGQAGHITIVVSEGRTVDGVSEGLTYKECAEVLEHYGCNFGVPLDGGGSSTMVYKGQILNHLPKERKLVDFIIFG